MATPLEEYYAGETIPWTVNVTAGGGEVKVTLRIGGRLIEEQTRKAADGPLRGTFDSRGLECGVYTIETGVDMPNRGLQTARRQILLTPNPWDN